MAGKGSLILVIGFGVIMMYIITNLTSLGTRATENMSWYNNATASKSLATIGTNQGLAWLRIDEDQRGVFFGGWQDITEGSYSGGRYYVEANNVGVSLVRLRTVSEYPMTRFRTIEDTIDVHIELERENEYTMYGWIANIPGNAQFFYGGDIVWGPIHQNGGIHMGNIPQNQQVPVFHGRVTATQNIQPVGGDRAIFLGGFNTGENRINVPEDFPELRSAAEARFNDVHGDLYIELDGSNVSIWYEGSDRAGSPDTLMSVADGSFNRAIYTTESASVKGTLSGQLEIGADKDIVIVGDVKYATTPAYDLDFIEHNTQYGLDRYTHEPHGDDLLGLYAGEDVVINAGNQDVELHGIMLALRELRVHEPQNMNGLYELNTWGSIIMRGRGDVRWTGGTEHKGYKQLYRYDVRLDDNSFRPEYFPGTSSVGFQIVSWYESIQIPPM